jgi:group I intron endonuclease
MARKIAGMTPCWNKSGIYKITCVPTGKIYIGSSKNLSRRVRRHFSKLSVNTHKNRYLQSAVDKYGLDSFRVDILEFCEVSELEARELYYFELTGCYNRTVGFNMVKTPGGGYCSGEDHYLYGKSMPEKTKKKLSNAHKWMAGENHNMYGARHSEETKIKIRNSMRGKFAGSKNPSAKLTKDDVKNIRELRNSGVLLRILSKQFGVSETHISRISRGLSW